MTRVFRNKMAPVLSRATDCKTIGELLFVWGDMADDEKDEYVKALNISEGHSDWTAEQSRKVSEGMANGLRLKTAKHLDDIRGGDIDTPHWAIAIRNTEPRFRVYDVAWATLSKSCARNILKAFEVTPVPDDKYTVFGGSNGLVYAAKGRYFNGREVLEFLENWERETADK